MVSYPVNSSDNKSMQAEMIILDVVFIGS